MGQSTIAILHPGEMGAAIGAGLAAQGHRVVWVSAGRGSATRRRAEENGLEDVGTLARAAREADIAFSVCPPHAALELAHALAACGFDGTYIDANAVSAGLPAGFHLAAADIYRRLEGFKDAAKPPAMDAVKAALLRKD